MAGKGFRLRWQPTTAGGTVSESMSTWTQVVNGSVKLNLILLQSGRADTVFDFKITTPVGIVLMPRKNVVYILSEKPDIIMRGLYSLTIENVRNSEGKTLDDTFSGEFMFQEMKNK